MSAIDQLGSFSGLVLKDRVVGQLEAGWSGSTWDHWVHFYKDFHLPVVLLAVAGLRI